MNLFPVDVVDTLHRSMNDRQRAPDGLLHCSSDLVGSLRHSMLTAAGAPRIEEGFVRGLAVDIGDVFHKRVANLLVSKGVPFMQEVRLNQWLPEGWAGTADWIFFHPEYQAFVLGDLKTNKGEGIKWLASGPKDEHLHQVSAYWYALRDMGLPLLKGFGILYLPKNEVVGERVEPILHEREPLDEGYMRELMESRWAATELYLSDVARSRHEWFEDQVPLYLHDTLAPAQDRVQRYFWNGTQNVFDVKLVPHWSAAYCPFPTELCDCREQKPEKIGHWHKQSEQDAKMQGYETWVRGWDWVEYKPRKGYEAIEPLVKPTEAEWRKRYGG
jgi:hypothetical protein